MGEGEEEGGHTPETDTEVDWEGLAADGDGAVGSGYDGGYPAHGVVDASYGQYHCRFWILVSWGAERRLKERGRTVEN